MKHDADWNKVNVVFQSTIWKDEIRAKDIENVSIKVKDQQATRVIISVKGKDMYTIDCENKDDASNWVKLLNDFRQNKPDEDVFDERNHNKAVDASLERLGLMDCCSDIIAENSPYGKYDMKIVEPDDLTEIGLTPEQARKIAENWNPKGAAKYHANELQKERWTVKKSSEGNTEKSVDMPGTKILLDFKEWNLKLDRKELPPINIPAKDITGVTMDQKVWKITISTKEMATTNKYTIDCINRDNALEWMELLNRLRHHDAPY